LAICDIAIFSEITEKEYVKDRYPTRQQKYSNCATLRGHVSNSWALVCSQDDYFYVFAKITVK